MKSTCRSGHSFTILYNPKVHEYLTNRSNRFVLNIRRTSMFGERRVGVGKFLRNADETSNSINFNDCPHSGYVYVKKKNIMFFAESFECLIEHDVVFYFIFRLLQNLFTPWTLIGETFSFDSIQIGYHKIVNHPSV